MQISYISKNQNTSLKDILIFVILWFCILLLLIFSSSNFNLLKTTIDLYIYTVFPAIFPFLFITNFLIQKDWLKNIVIGENKLICKILKISRCSLPVIIIGSIFGYPNSINYATSLLEKGYISKNEYTKLIIMCNNPSIIYILSSIGIGVFNNIKIGIILFFAITISNVLICICYRPDINIIQQTSTMSNGFSKKNSSFFDVILTSLSSSLKNLMFILGFMLLFTLTANCITNFLHLNDILASIIFGIFEITSGIKMVATNFENTYIILYAVCFILSFSSFMVIFQLYSFCHKYIKINKLVLCKLIQGLTSCITLYILFKLVNINMYVNVFSNLYKPKNTNLNIYIYILPLVIIFLLYIKSSWQKRQLQKGDNV